jgi:hypothetical protein
VATDSKNLSMEPDSPTLKREDIESLLVIGLLVYPAAATLNTGNMDREAGIHAKEVWLGIVDALVSTLNEATPDWTMQQRRELMDAAKADLKDTSLHLYSEMYTSGNLQANVGIAYLDVSAWLNHSYAKLAINLDLIHIAL